MNSENRPKPPVITSLAGAIDQVHAWLEQNRMNVIRDGDGLPWALAVSTTHEPHPDLPRALIWNVSIRLRAEPTPEELVRTGTLDPVGDRRLLELLGERPVPLVMKPLKYRVNNEEEARSLIAQVVPNLKASLARSPLEEVKRRLIGRWVDEHCHFGSGGF